jgi:hypothetical protein
VQHAREVGDLDVAKDPLGDDFRADGDRERVRPDQVRRELVAREGFLEELVIRRVISFTPTCWIAWSTDATCSASP